MVQHARTTVPYSVRGFTALQAVLFLFALGKLMALYPPTLLVHWFNSPDATALVTSLLAAILWVGSQGLALGRWHHLLRSVGASVHLAASVRLLLAASWTEWRPLWANQGPISLSDLNQHWFGMSSLMTSQVERFNGWPALLPWSRSSSAQQSSASSRSYELSERRTAMVYALGEWTLWCTALLLALVAGSTDRGFPGLSWLWVLPVARLIGTLTRLGDGFGCRELFILWALNPTHPSLSPIVALPWIYGVGLAALVKLLVGFWVVRREEFLRRTLPLRPRAMSISAVMPVLNEAPHLARTIERLRRIPEIREVILVDGGSRDETVRVAKELGCLVLETAAGRGHQMRAGAEVATSDVVLLLHADTWFAPDAGAALGRCLQDPTVVAGGFWKRFDETPWLLLGSRPKCLVRWWVGRRIVGDMGMFIRRDILTAIGGVPDMELMEDFELSARLRRVGRLALADSTVITSSRRFREHGVIRTYLKMWLVATLYRLGKSPSELRKIYG